jgi:tRNA-Thr(GGU) m(6)t(6)A37 methyltransferase TsaA
MKHGWVEIGKVTRAAAHTGLLDNRIAASSTITIHPEYAEGLDGLEEGTFLEIVYLFHKSADVKLRDMRLDGQEKGIFATRSPKRPSKVGITRVMLISRRGRELEVSGLDAWEGSPVIDIKPCDRITENH